MDSITYIVNSKRDTQVSQGSAATYLGRGGWFYVPPILPSERKTGRFTENEIDARLLKLTRKDCLRDYQLTMYTTHTRSFIL